MAYSDPTTNYNWNLPFDGGDTGNWGDLLNELLGNETTGVDAVVKAISDVADAALPKAGGTMTGLLTHDVVREGVGAISSTEIDWATGNVFTKTIAAPTTFTFANLPSTGVAQFITVRITAGVSDTITWPTVLWHNGSAPVQTSDGTDVYVFYCEAGTVYGARCLEDVS